jgi:hypothetical protein
LPAKQPAFSFNSTHNRDYRSLFVAVWGLGIEASQSAQHFISANWRDVITAIQRVVTIPDTNDVNQQVRMLLSEFIDFLGYFGYRKFQVLMWRGLQLLPKFMLRKQKLSNYMNRGFLQFSNLLSAPNSRVKG